MMTSEGFNIIPWDSAVFGVPTYEIRAPSQELLDLAMRVPGHYTVRIDPLASKKLLHDYGFYYCDTLIEPYCTAMSFSGFDSADVGISLDNSIDSLLAISKAAFSHGRFHRDYNISSTHADQRYDNWLAQLHADGKVYGLLYREELAGFIAVDNNRFVLHAITKSLRGQGLAKNLWTPVCRILFQQGCTELVSSISSANQAVLNLYATLGFRFRRPVDVYHRLTK